MEILQPYLPDSISLATLVGVSAVSFLGSFITVSFGIGGGILVIAVLANLLPAAALIPVHGAVQLASNTSRMILFFRYIEWSGIATFALGALIGCAIGGLITTEVPTGAVLIGVGAFVLFSVFTKPPRFLSKIPILTGAISSILTMFFGATGSFVAVLTKAKQLDRYGHVGTHGTLMSIQHALKLAVFGFLGFAFSDWWLVIAAMIIAGFLGTLVGKFFLAKISETAFKKALNAILVIMAIRLIWSGATQF